MNRTVWIYVCGIRTKPGKSKNWTGKAVTWTHLNVGHYAEKVEYFTNPFLSKVFGQSKRVTKLCSTLDYYRNWKINLVGHSNGCDVIAKALYKEHYPQIESLHLISAATSSDFNKNKLNIGLDSGKIKKCSVYIAEKDWPLRLASTFTARFLFKYGSLGLKGPKNNNKECKIIRRVNYGHGTWFEDENFDKTMRLIHLG